MGLPNPKEWKAIPENKTYKGDNQLRGYQFEGVNWLTFCYYNRLVTVNSTCTCWLTYIDFVLLGALHAPLIALSWFIGAHGTDVSVGVSLLSGETL